MAVKVTEIKSGIFKKIAIFEQMGLRGRLQCLFYEIPPNKLPLITYTYKLLEL